ncbi:hypothetical protein ACRS2S_05490 [Achromobacter xylosoxidans]|uniref:hypothetical protein n=1 Tax=Alcaligenes xylosoxydans xylosoxydans TaxID=85698 RepID=UPI003EE11120
MLSSLSRGEVIRLLEKEFHFSSDEAATKLSTVNEHIRAVLLLESQQSPQKDVVPVSTITITRTVRRRLAPLWPELADDARTDAVVLGELRKMSALGEVAEADTFHWIPAPARTIYIDDATHLLISASPISNLQPSIRKALQVVGRARLINGEAELHMPPLQRLEDWLGGPHDNVEIWSKAFMNRAARAMQPVENFDQLDFFQNGRWRSPKNLVGPLSTVGLYRRKVFIYGNAANEYGLCRLQAGKDGMFRVISSLVIEKNDARRLQASMRLAGGHQQVIRYEETGPIVALELPQPLPAPENALLGLGWVLGESASTGWPKRLAFSVRLMPLLRRAFGLLGYKLVERANGESRYAE